jgi:hypothetical protein
MVLILWMKQTIITILTFGGKNAWFASSAHNHFCDPQTYWCNRLGMAVGTFTTMDLCYDCTGINCPRRNIYEECNELRF